MFSPFFLTQTGTVALLSFGFYAADPQFSWIIKNAHSGKPVLNLWVEGYGASPLFLPPPLSMSWGFGVLPTLGLFCEFF